MPAPVCGIAAQRGLTYDGRMSASPWNLYRAAEVRALDRAAMDVFNIPGQTMMARAGRAAFNELRTHWPQAQRITVMCGVGNNGGDGYVLAHCVAQAGMAVTVLQVGDAARVQGDAQEARRTLLESGVSILPFAASGLHAADVIVDALLGIGLGREVAGEWRTAIEVINAAQTPVLALDIPSGLHADTGCVWGVAVQAASTVCFVALKQGLFTADGPDHCGNIVLHDLDLPPQLFERTRPAAVLLAPDNLVALAPRHRNTHKGDYGRVLVIGGDHGMPGAVRLAAEAAARTGAGRVTLATRQTHAVTLSGQRPELLCYGVAHGVELKPLLAAADVAVIGPGLGQSPWARELFSTWLESSALPCVVDADALTLLATEPVTRSGWVLTPHPGEAARLLGCSTTEIQADRFQAAQALQRRYGGVCVLKGAGTLVVSADGPIAVCAAGNPGMASAGMGDVLSGVIAALLAQGLNGGDAARLGVWLHATAGDRAAAEGGMRGLLAGDLMPYLRTLVNSL